MQTAADQCNALMHSQAVLYLLDHGWTPERIEDWMLDALVRTVTTMDPARSP